MSLLSGPARQGKLQHSIWQQKATMSLLLKALILPGGVCALRGCQAKKYFYEVAELVARSHHLLGKGIATAPIADWHQILAEKNSFTKEVPKIRLIISKEMASHILRERQLFVDESTVAVNNVNFTADYYVVAVGAKPTSLPFEGNEYMITSDDFLELKTCRNVSLLLAVVLFPLSLPISPRVWVAAKGIYISSKPLRGCCHLLTATWSSGW